MRFGIRFVTLGGVFSLVCVANVHADFIDGSFETPVVGSGTYNYNPTGGAWTYGSTSGIISPPSDFGAPTAVDGSQIAFLQSNASDSHDTGTRGTISQSLVFPSDGMYQFSIQQSARENVNGGVRPSYQVQIDGVAVGGTQIPSVNGAFKSYGFTFQAPSGAHQVSLVSVGPTDSTTFLDAASIQSAAPTAGRFSQSAFTGDADSGISSSKTYTHAVNLNGPDVTVNGVTFKGGGTTGTNYTHTTNGGTYTGNTNNLVGDSKALATTFVYGGNETLTLTGLTPGEMYKTTLYGVAFGNPGGRFVDVTDSQGGSMTGFDENAYGSGNGILLSDTYTAVGDSISLNFANQSDGDSFHLYAFTNEAVPEPSAIALVGSATVGLLGARKRRVAAL